MGFISPALPAIDREEWNRLSHLERIKPLAQDWGINGFGSPYAVHLLYIVKNALFAFGGLLLISTTSGLGGIGNVGEWWTEPIVFQKAVAWTMLWEALGLGSGSLPLTFRFSPPIGGPLYWLRPGTIRLPPWPDRVPLTRGDSRTPLDIALYMGFIGSLLVLLIADGEAAADTSAGRLDPAIIAVALGFLALLGLRDKVPFLAARTEVYAPFLIVFLFPLENLIVGAQLVMCGIWFWAATSKLNRHFPFVVTVMMSNTPWNRSRSAKRRLWRNHPEDMLPSRFGEMNAHAGTVIEYTMPLLLLFSSGGTFGTIAVAVMVAFHVHIFSTFPLGVPLEWNIFMVFSLLFLFGHFGDVPLSTFDDPLLGAILAVCLIGIPLLGNLRPDLISFLPSMRYYAGNWATSQWLFRKGKEDKLNQHIVKAAPLVVDQLTKLYDRETAEFMLYSGLAFRSMHSHGRALNGLALRAVDDVEGYDVREGEFVAGVVAGYNFGDGHFHDEQLLAAVQRRCKFAPGELRVVMLESQPAHVQRQRYRIHDAATGLVEEGFVEVADMVTRQPWLDETGDFPVQVTGGGAPAVEPAPAA